MGTITNPDVYSTTTGSSSTAQITDTVDYPHSGLIKALSLGITGSYPLSIDNGFDITFADGGSFTSIAVTAGKVMRNGKVKDVDALSAELMDTTYNPGTGNVDITPHATNDVYLLLVAKDGGSSNDTMVLRGSNAVTDRVPDYSLGDIPIAIIKITGGSDDDSTSASDRMVQYLTTKQTESHLSIGRDSSGYTEAFTITNDSNSDTILESHMNSKDMIFKVDRSGTSSEILRLDAGDNRVRVVSIVDGAGEGPTLNLHRDPTSATTADNDLIGVISFTGEDSGNSEEEYVKIYAQIIDESNTTEDAQFFIRTKKAGSLAYNLKMTPTQTIFNANNDDIDVRIDGATDNLFYADSSADKIGLGTSAPKNKLQVSHTAADGDNGIMIVREDASTADGDVLGGIGFDSTDGNVPSSVLESSAFIASYATEAHGSGDKGGNLKLGVSLIDENEDVVSTNLVNVGPPDTTANATCHAGLNSRATTAVVAAATYAPTIEDSGTLVIFKHANSNLTLPSINNDTSVGVQFTVFNETGSAINAQIAVSNSATVNGGAISASDDIASYKAATFVCSGNNTWIRIG